MKKTFYNRRCISAVYRETEQYPSLNGGADLVPDSGKTEIPKYTGSYVVGLATMHKSNIVPVSKGVNTNPKLHSGGTD